MCLLNKQTATKNLQKSNKTNHFGIQIRVKWKIFWCLTKRYVRMSAKQIQDYRAIAHANDQLSQRLGLLTVVAMRVSEWMNDEIGNAMKGKRFPLNQSIVAFDSGHNWKRRRTIFRWTQHTPSIWTCVNYIFKCALCINTHSCTRIYQHSRCGFG